ncbi:MAG: prolyl oligopeptidase family serine peptidase [Fibrobacteres bacterium]|nr:prolyl oligopeptidase family serine peptidase [Fibrobacterota bacterium]
MRRCLIPLPLLAGLSLAWSADADRFRLDRYEPGPQPPAFDTSLLEPLESYGQVHSASFAGWADTGLYIGTQLGRYPQIHSVAAPGADRRQVTFFPRRIATAEMNPVPSRRNFLYSYDEGGDEQFQLRLFDLARGRSLPLGMPPGRAEGTIWNDSGTTFAYAHVPAGTDRWDIRLGRPNGFDSLLLSLPGSWSPMDLRPDGKRLLIQRYVSAAEAELYALDIPGGTLTLLSPGPPAFIDDAAWVKAGGNSRDTSWQVVFTSDRDGEAHRLYRLDPDSVLPAGGFPAAGTGPTRPMHRATATPAAISAPGPWDVEWVSVAPDRRTLAWSVNEEGYSRVHVLAPGSKTPKALTGGPRGLFQEAKFRPGPHPREFALAASNGSMPGDVWTCDWAQDRWTRWTFSETGGLPAAAFRLPQLARYPGGSGGPGAGIGKVPAWVYRPDSLAFPGPRPVVIQIHGGPEQQARPGFEAYVQFLCGSMGYVVILPNVRGSSGYGKSWLKADDGYARMGAVRDIGALLDWIGRQPGMDPRRVAVSGRSYGGFMSLASLVEYGPRLKAGISIVGISHFPTFLKQTSGYRRDLRRVEYGDERDPRMAAFLDSISPLTRADRIRTPLLLIHGRNDPRVPYGESERIFAAVKARRVPTWFLTFEDAGHGVHDLDDQKAQWRVETEFLARHLGTPSSGTRSGPGSH